MEGDTENHTEKGDIRYPEMSGLPTHINHREARELIAEAVYLDRQIQGEPVADMRGVQEKK